MSQIQKNRYWWSVLYPENMVENWEDLIGDIVQVPYAYAIHDADTDSKSEHRKDHVHLILVFPNTTTYAHALNVFKLLGEKATNTCKACVSIRNCYDYLIHDTESCRKQGKHVYPKTHRVCGNNFDIGAYEQISQEEKDEMLQELFDFVIDNAIENSADFYILMREHFDKSYFSIYRGHTGAIDRLCRGNFLRSVRAENIENWYSNQDENDSERVPRDTQGHAKCCPNCDSEDIKKKGKTAVGSARFQCKECGKTFV